jgi:hypothetical protein
VRGALTEEAIQGDFKSARAYKAWRTTRRRSHLARGRKTTETGPSVIGISESSPPSNVCSWEPYSGNVTCGDLQALGVGQSQSDVFSTSLNLN